MTYAPARLKELAAYWTVQGGVNLGIVGDTDHQAKGVSYHLGRDQLSPGAYSAERARDIAGLTNAASAIDLGRLGGSYAQLRAFSDWLARRCVKNDPATVDVVEVIYSPDGKRVLGFKDGVDFLIPNYGDLSHLTHTHISFYRDSEFRDKVDLFRPYFQEAPIMAGPEVRNLQPYVAKATVKGAGHSAILANDGSLVGLPEGAVKDVVAVGTLLTKWAGHPDGRVLLVGDEPAWLLWEDVTLSDVGHNVIVDGQNYEVKP